MLRPLRPTATAPLLLTALMWVARNAEQDRPHPLTGHLLGRLDGLADRRGRLFGVDDDPAAQTLGRHTAGADDAQRAVGIHFRDQAANFGRAHVNRAHQFVGDDGVLFFRWVLSEAE